MYEIPLTQAGLTGDQAKIYEILLLKGPIQASTVKRQTDISRPLVYKILDDLKNLGLVEERKETGKPARFQANHPLKLRDLVDGKRKAAEAASAALDGVLGQITSDFNLTSGKPGVRFYEGLEGIKAVVNDALTSKTEIYSYIDIEAVERLIPEISRDFARARQKLGIKKKNIGIDTPENRKEIENYYPDITEERLIPWPTEKFGVVMQIYDNKVSYITLEGKMVGVILADPHIYQMHKSLFETTWQHPQAFVHHPSSTLPTPPSAPPPPEV